MHAHLLLAWDWEYDAPFVALLEETFRRRGLTLLPVQRPGLARLLDALSVGRYTASAFLDRASDVEDAYLPLVEWARLNAPGLVNPYPLARRAWVKTAMHWEFIRAGLHTPYTLALPAHKRTPEIYPPPNLKPLGVPFVVKPAEGGGGWAVSTNAVDWEDVQRARMAEEAEDFLLQAHVEPLLLEARSGPRRAWFRVLYACGRVLPCWWDDRTRLYGGPVTQAERDLFGLGSLWDIARAAAGIARLGLFSTEVARVADGRFVAVDYVNDPIDLRLKSVAATGVPDEVVQQVCEALADWSVQT
ncbi:MAG: hypothetical protein HY784_00795 [Chloroflexi bacterium]|nr:hypothetical protein [Chloroflexota bacterium]